MHLAAIIAKPQKAELCTLLPELTEWLREHGYGTVLDRDAASYVPGVEGFAREELPEHRPNLVIVLGGDGTLIAAARAFASTGTPILSVNLGSLGFLTEVPMTELYGTLESWCRNEASIDTREMMNAALFRDGALVRQWTALNDVVVAKGTIARMADFTVEIDSHPVATFRADGIIVATPTGSTAYNLAANGPIVMPNVAATVVTPICPHILTLRPIVVPSSATVAIHVVGVPNETYLTVDGQEGMELYVGDHVSCSRSEHCVRLLRHEPNDLFKVLRSKLKWGVR